ncbi:MAG: bleomycin resistance protein [Eubacterium sp.]
MKFNKLIPELTVSDIEKSKQFYTDILGFKIEYERSENKFVFLSLGEAQIMLEEENGNWSIGELKYPFGNGVNFQIEVDNLEQIVTTIKAKGIELFKDIFCSKYQCGNFVYVEKEFLILDPDGYMLRFSETVESVEE